MQAAAARGIGVELLAINHWETAVETHAKNHPAANHLCANLESVDPSKVVPGGKLDLLLASPECVHHSNARGGRPMSDQSRASAWHVLHWAERLRVESIVVENVREFMTWGPLGANGRPLKSRKGDTFAAWINALQSLGYRVEWRILNAADFGAATTRRRLFIVATRKHGGPRWPTPTHGKAVDGLFAGDLAPWRAAREIIDWTIPSGSIFDRARPLAPNTLARIEEGLRRFGGAAAEPFLVLLRGTQDGQIRGSARPTSDPVPTITAGGGHCALVEPFLLSQQSGGAPRATTEPTQTIATKGAIGLVEPFLVPFYGERLGQAPRSHDVDEPVPTIPTDPKFGLCEPYLVEYHGEKSGERPRVRTIGEPLTTLTTENRLGLVEPFILAPLGIGRGNAPQSVENPLGTVLASRGGGHLVEPFVVQYNGESGARPASEPLSTVTTRDRFGLVEARHLDIRFRMLQPAELAAATGFPLDYKFSGNRGEVVRQIGNAVEVNVARALCGAVLS